MQYHLWTLWEAMATHRPALFVSYMDWVKTTLTSYGKINGGRQLEVMRELRRRRMEGPSNTIDVTDLIQYVKLQTRQQLVDL
jgi:hypothetical protein